MKRCLCLKSVNVTSVASRKHWNIKLMIQVSYVVVLAASLQEPLHSVIFDSVRNVQKRVFPEVCSELLHSTLRWSEGMGMIFPLLETYIL